jgi:hypothetical protein
MNNQLRFLALVNEAMDDRGRPVDYLDRMLDIARRVSDDTDPEPVAAAFIRWIFHEPLQPRDRETLGLPPE